MNNLAQLFEQMDPVKKALLAAGLILALSLAAYANSFNAGFFLDDNPQIVLNNNIRSLSNIPRFFTEAQPSSFQQYKGYRPVTFTCFTAIYSIFGYRTWGYHLFNLLLHFANSLLVYTVVRRILKDGGIKDGCLSALLVSLVFAVHPIETAAVTYISGMAVLLATLFLLAAFHLFLRFRSGEAPGRLFVLLAPAFYLAGLLSKEMAVSLPAVMLAYDFIFTVPRRGGFSRSAKTWVYYIPFAAALTVYLQVKLAMQGGLSDKNIPFGRWEYLMSEGKALLMYLRLLLFPVNQNADYALPPTTSLDAWVVLSFTLVAIVLLFLYRLGKSDKAAAFFGSWFFITLAPESSLIPIRDIAFEHRLYLPSAGFFAAAILLAARHPYSKPSLKPWPWAAVLGLLLALTLQRNAVWRTNTSIWSDVARKSPHSARAHTNLGAALLNEGRYSEAMGEFFRSLGIRQDSISLALLYENIERCLAGMGMTEEAHRMFDRAVAANPGVAEVYEYNGEVYYKEGRYLEAVGMFEKAVSLDPSCVPARMFLAKSYTRLGRGGEALSEMKEAYRYSRDNFVISYNLAVVYEENGMHDDALKQALETLELAHDDTQKRNAERLVGLITARRNNH